MNIVLNTPELRREILSHIPPKYPREQVDFRSYLDNYALVSKAWNTDAKIAKQIWVEKDFVPFCTYGGLETADDLKEFISERKFEHVNLSEASSFLMNLPNIRINDLVLSDILNVCANLHSLDLSMTEITNGIVGDIFISAPKLQSLTLGLCKISDDGFVDIKENNQLHSLNLSSCYGISGVGLERIFKIFLHLKSLNLNFICIIDEDFVNIPQGNHLQSLSVRNNQGITDVGINNILEKCALGLQVLNIAEALFITRAGIRAILNRCSSLQTLHVTQAQSKRVDLTLAEKKKIEIVIEESAVDGEWLDDLFDHETSEDF